MDSAQLPVCWKLRLADDDPSKQPWINDELLEGGRLRFGWGFDGCDLRKLREKRNAHQALDETQELAWSKAHRLLQIQPRDLIFTPNVPQYGHFGVFRVTGEYWFDDASADPEYRGHVIPVETVIANINKLHESVSAQILGSAFTQRAITEMGAPPEHIQALIEVAEAPDTDLSAGNSEMEHVARIVQEATDTVADGLVKSFRGKSFEVPVRRLMEALYADRAGGSVDYGRRLDHSGIDILVRAKDPLGFDRLIAVQVKKWENEPDAQRLEHEALGDIRRAKEARPDIDAGLVFTLLDHVPAEIDTAAAKLGDEMGIDVRVITRDEAADLFLRHLGGLVDEAG